MQVTRLAGLTRVVTSTDLSNVRLRLGSESQARMPALAHLCPIATFFSIASLRRGVGIELIRMLHGARAVDAVFSGDEG